MLHDIGVVLWLSISMCQVGLSNGIVESFVFISAGTSDTSGLTSIEYPYDSLTEMLHVTVFSY